MMGEPRAETPNYPIRPMTDFRALCAELLEAIAPYRLLDYLNAEARIRTADRLNSVVYRAKTALEGDWQTGLPPSPGFYYVRDLLHENIGGDNRPVYVNPEHFVWGFTENDDPEWIGLDSDITPENIQWKPAAPPSLKDQALAQLASLHAELKMHGLVTNTDDIRRLLEALPND